MYNEKQQQAHDLYFATCKTQQEIADILDVTRKTINGWIKKNRWDDMKAATRQMPSIILQNIYDLFTAVNDKILSRSGDDRCPTMEEVEKLRKLLTMTKSIQKQHTGSYMEAFQELRLFIFNRDSALADQLSGHISAYLNGTMGDKEFMTRKRRRDNVLDATATLAKQEMREQEEQEMEQECNPGVTLCNNSYGVPHLQKLTASPAQHEQRSADTLSSCSSSDPAQECNPGVTFCNKNEHHAPSLAHPAKVFTVGANGEITPPQDAEGCNTSGHSENVTFSANKNDEFAKQATQNVSSPSGAEAVMALPPHMRPSPFIDGNTVWILHPDHLEGQYDTYGNKWGPMKMNYTIRYYPDVDPSNIPAAA